MGSLLSIFSLVLSKYLSIIFSQNEQVDPILLNKERFNVRSVFICYIIYLKSKGFEYSKVNPIVNWFREINFKQTLLFEAVIRASNNILIELVENNLFSLSSIADVENVDPAVLYELMLGVESRNENANIEVKKSNNYRNKLGSYYTPKLLARETTKKAIDKYVDENLFFLKDSEELIEELCKLKFADFSCGGGSFLVEILDYVKDMSKILIKNSKKRESLIEKLASNIHGFDVDCIALEVAKFNVLLHLDNLCYNEKIQGNYIQANFLLHTQQVATSEEKVEVFSSGFVYHPTLAIDPKQLGSFDIILGNPPWEKIRFEEKKFYALYSNLISSEHFKADRLQKIQDLNETNSALAKFSSTFIEQLEKSKDQIKKNTFFDLSNGGELNTYALFTEASLKLRSKNGIIALILKSAIITSQVNKKLFGSLSQNNKIFSIYDFINTKKIFEIDSRERFCVFIMGDSKSNHFEIKMNLKQAEDIAEKDSTILLSSEDLMALNSITGMVPNFSTTEEFVFLLRTSKNLPLFKTVFSELRFGRIVHFTAHADFIIREKKNGYLPIYEGKFFKAYDANFSGFNNVSSVLRYGSKSSSRQLSEIEKSNGITPESRFFISEEKWLKLSKNHDHPFMLGWRSLTSATNARTCIATILPFLPASQSVQFLTGEASDLIYLNGLFNSVIFDFILKKKLSGIDLTQAIINQMPVPLKSVLEYQINLLGENQSIYQHIQSLVFHLLKSDPLLLPLKQDVYLKELPDYPSNRREILRLIDLLFMFCYDVSDQDIDMILGPFGDIYNQADNIWFVEKLQDLKLYKTVRSSSSLITHFSPQI